MDVSILLKVIGIALIVAVAHQILSRSGRDEQATLVSIGGIIVILLMLLGSAKDLLSSLRSLFGL